MINTRNILEAQFPAIKPQHVKVRIGAPIEVKNLSEEAQKHIGAYVQAQVKADIQALLTEEKD